jgi:hypothetical protein
LPETDIESTIIVNDPLIIFFDFFHFFPRTPGSMASIMPRLYWIIVSGCLPGVKQEYRTITSHCTPRTVEYAARAVLFFQKNWSNPYDAGLFWQAAGLLRLGKKEEYRTYLGDRLVLGLVKPDDFIYRQSAPKGYVDEEDMKAKRPVEMKPAMNRTFIAAYESMMNRTVQYPPLNKTINYRWLIYQQVKSFGNSLENPDILYQPFVRTM